MAFKVAKMREAIMKDQDEFLMRLEINNRAVLEDVGQNAAALRFVLCTFKIQEATRNFRRLVSAEL